MRGFFQIHRYLKSSSGVNHMSNFVIKSKKNNKKKTIRNYERTIVVFLVNLVRKKWKTKINTRWNFRYEK